MPSHSKYLLTSPTRACTDARGSQIFVNLNDNADLDGQGFAPFAELVDPDDALKALNACAEVKGVDQTAAKEHGAEYFKTFPALSVWESAVCLD
mgnify:CR=1 FL=1